MLRRLLALCLLPLGLAGAAQDYDRDSALAISQAALGARIGDYRLRDTHGQAFDLAQLSGRPLVISLIYTSCHHVCPMITRSLAETLAVAREALGDDAFSVVSVGFDWQNDTPERMRQFAMQQGVNGITNWHFLAADGPVVDALSEDVGFLFYPSAKGFDHLTQTTIVDRNGRVYRQLYGVEIGTQTLVEPLKELVFDTPRSAGLIEHWVSTFKLFCTVYDPNSDRYRFDYSILMTIATGVLCLGALATFIVREWRGAR